MEIETSYKFDGDAQISEMAAFLSERHVESGWSIDGEPESVGAYSSGRFRIRFVEEFEADE